MNAFDFALIHSVDARLPAVVREPPEDIVEVSSLAGMVSARAGTTPSRKVSTVRRTRGRIVFMGWIKRVA
jgi:hypothetical protein